SIRQRSLAKSTSSRKPISDGSVESQYLVGALHPRATRSAKALAPLVSNPEDVLMRALQPNTEALRLLALYIRELDDGYRLATPELLGAVVTHLVDLGSLIIGANRDGTVVAEDRGLAAARL